MLRTFVIRQGKLSAIDDLEEVKKIWLAQEEIIWVDLEAPEEEEYQFLVKELKLHPLAVEDCRDVGSIPKMEEYNEFLFFIFRGINCFTGIHALDTLGIKLFLTKGKLVTVHHKHSKTIVHVIRDVEKNVDLMDSSEQLFFTILDTLTDNIMPVIKHVEDRLEAFQHHIFKKFDPVILEEVFELKKWVLRLKRFVLPQKKIIRNLLDLDHPLLEGKLNYYLRDVLDHTSQVLDHLEIYEELFPDAMNSYLSQVTNRMNEVMKTMSVIATLMLPLSFITGIFGMNFSNLPMTTGSWGFWVVMGVMGVIFGVMVYFFKQKEWF